MSTRVAFVGLGSMGGPMALNLAKQFDVVAFDVVKSTSKVPMASSVAEATKGASFVVTALPAAKDVEVVFNEALAAADDGTTFVDCSTVPPSFARRLAERAAERKCFAVDAPMSGGVLGAEKGTLTFMVGGAEDVVERARPLLAAMGAHVRRAGPSGAGAAAKLCNNMILACQMIAVSEGLHMAESFGLDVAQVYEVLATATARSWALNDYPPVPGVATRTSPANHDFKPGFAASLMLKDLTIAMAAAEEHGTSVPLAHRAHQLYDAMLRDPDLQDKDFSAIINLLRKQSARDADDYYDDPNN